MNKVIKMTESYKQSKSIMTQVYEQNKFMTKWKC